MVRWPLVSFEQKYIIFEQKYIMEGSDEVGRQEYYIKAHER